MRKEYLPRKQRYEEAREILQERNSFSKTDHDATFMRMKEDHMMNGQLKPSYNVQAATNGQYVLACDIFSNPTDTRTLKPFLQSIQTLDLFRHIVADAGYGSEENDSFIIDELEKTPLIPYGMYQKEMTRKYQNSPTNPKNWDYIEETDQFIKPDGLVYSFKHYSRRTDKYGFERDFKIYEVDKIQSTPELEQLAKTEGGNQKQIHYNSTWNYFKEVIKTELHSEEGSRIYAKRKSDSSS